MVNHLPSVVIEPAGKAEYCVIWLHGLGADGHDFEPIVTELGLPDSLSVRFVFPHAPMRPITLNNGNVMRAWYDIYDLSFDRQEDAIGLADSELSVRNLIEREIDAGVTPEKIVLAGFSQGGALALHTGLHLHYPLAGIMALSCYMPLLSRVTEQSQFIQHQKPIFWAHGTLDDVVPYALAVRSRDHLRTLGLQIHWHEYVTGHTVTVDEINDIRSWLLSVF